MLKLLALAALLAAATAAPGDYPPILNLHQTDSTLTTVTLAWTLDVTEFVPVTYTLHVDGILTIQFFHDGTFTYIVTGLQSCHQDQFDLTANYAGEEDGPTSYAGGSTLYETPGAVGDLSVDGSVVSWTAPDNAKCVQYYTVCHESTVTEDSGCLEGVISTSYDLGVLSACDELDVTVYANGGNLVGPPSTVHVTTPDGVPGPVRDLEVSSLTETSVVLFWNPPLENPACCKEIAIVFGPATNFTVATESDESEEEEGGMAKGRIEQQESAILEDLMLCTDYRFGVACVSESHVYGDEEVVYLSTNESAPGMLPDVVFDPSLDSITISWGDVSQEGCLGNIEICYVDPVDDTYECVVVPSSPNTWTVTGLGACREYEFRITGLSPDGLPGEPIVVTVPTLDRAPGPVQNMALDNVEMTSLTVTYDPPIEYPECVAQYIVEYRNILDVLDTSSAGTGARSLFTADIDGLAACAIYEIGVGAVSTTGIAGPVTFITTPMDQGVPGPPSGAQQVTETETSLSVLWFAPTETRFCVDTYEVRVSEAGAGPTQLIPVLDFNQQLLETFTGLDFCTSYEVQIRSINSDTNSASAYATVLSDANTLC